jgi:hypothetical protein
LGLIPVASAGANATGDKMPGDKVVDYSFVKAP